MWERCSRAALLGILVTASGAAALRTLTTVSGLSIPAVGLGTAARINASTVATAIDLGVKLLDTAQAAEWYDEAGVGTGIRMSRRQRDELWITTKVHPRSFGPRSTLARFEQSQMHLNTTYVDALLLHYTCCFGDLCKGAVIEGDWMDAWRVFEDLNRKGHARVIGASNVDVEFLDALWQFADVKPQLVQNRMEPFHQDRAVRWQTCCQRGSRSRHHRGHRMLMAPHQAWRRRSQGRTDPSRTENSAPAKRRTVLLGIATTRR